jgi:hypothetical protein
VSPEPQLVQAAVNISKTSWFFVSCNAVAKYVHVDVYPTAGQCHACEYTIVTVHVLQQQSADCLEVNNYVSCYSKRDLSFTNDKQIQLYSLHVFFKPHKQTVLSAGIQFILL